MNIELTRLPWGDLCLTKDKNLPPRALAQGNIRIDSLVGLPEVAALKADDVVLDCGAFVGDNTVEFTERCEKVYAFEPFFDAFVCLKWNAPKAIAFNVPLGDGRKVEFKYECNGDNQGMRMMVPSKDGIETFRIDGMNLPKVTFVKLDVEGFELFALDGMAETIRRCRPILYVEVFPDALKQNGFTPEDLEAKLRGFDYDLRFVGELPRWDWLCTPK